MNKIAKANYQKNLWDLNLSDAQKLELFSVTFDKEIITIKSL